MHAPVQVHALVVQVVISLILQVYAQHVPKDAQHVPVQQIAQYAILVITGHYQPMLLHAHAHLVIIHHHQQQPVAVHVLMLIARYVQLQALASVPNVCQAII